MRPNKTIPTLPPAILPIVDDDAYSQDLIARWLGKLEYRALTASDNRQALEILRQQPCDLVRLDIMMPEINYPRNRRPPMSPRAPARRAASTTRYQSPRPKLPV